MEITDRAKVFVASQLGCEVDTLEVRSVKGGYSRNRKSLVGIGDNWLFAKEVDITLLPNDGSEELGWLKKEFGLMQHLASSGFSVAPEWCILSDDGTVLLMTAYRSDEGWLWGYPQDADSQFAYVDTVVRSVIDLESAAFSDRVIEDYSLQPFFRDELAFDGGFERLLNNNPLREKVKSKVVNLADSRHSQLLQDLSNLLDNRSELESLAQVARQLANQPNDAFGHCDVRSDNLTFNPNTGEVKLVDWNWASATPSKFGSTEFITDGARQGVDITPWLRYASPQLLAASVGYYARRCIKDPLMPGDNLRKMQAEAAAISYDLYKKVIAL